MRVRWVALVPRAKQAICRSPHRCGSTRLRIRSIRGECQPSSARPDCFQTGPDSDKDPGLFFFPPPMKGSKHAVITLRPPTRRMIFNNLPRGRTHHWKGVRLAYFADVAQLVECLPSKQVVVSSRLTVRSNSGVPVHDHSCAIAGTMGWDVPARRCGERTHVGFVPRAHVQTQPNWHRVFILVDRGSNPLADSSILQSGGAVVPVGLIRQRSRVQISPLQPDQPHTGEVDIAGDAVARNRRGSGKPGAKIGHPRNS